MHFALVLMNNMSVWVYVKIALGIHLLCHNKIHKANHNHQIQHCNRIGYVYVLPSHASDISYLYLLQVLYGYIKICIGESEDGRFNFYNFATQLIAEQRILHSYIESYCFFNLIFFSILNNTNNNTKNQHVKNQINKGFVHQAFPISRIVGTCINSRKTQFKLFF